MVAASSASGWGGSESVAGYGIRSPAGMALCLRVWASRLVSSLTPAASARARLPDQLSEGSRLRALRASVRGA